MSQEWGLHFFEWGYGIKKQLNQNPINKRKQMSVCAQENCVIVRRPKSKPFEWEIATQYHMYNTRSQ